jgi:integrase
LGNKKKVLLYIDQAVVTEAKEIGLNLSKTSENALKYATKRLKSSDYNNNDSLSTNHDSTETEVVVGARRFELPTFQKEAFKDFCRIDLHLAKTTTQNYCLQAKRFHEYLQDSTNSRVDKKIIRQYLKRFRNLSSYGYTNVLNGVRTFLKFSDQEKLFDFKYPRNTFKIRSLPRNGELTSFFNMLQTNRAKALFLFYATTGLRKQEVLSLRLKDVDFENRMVIPRLAHETNTTKKTWITFYNTECEDYLNQYLQERGISSNKLFPISQGTFCRIWREGRQNSGVRLSPQIMRVWFATEMARLKVPDRYVDAFCGRIPSSILAKHYSDFSPDTLKEIYDKARLTVITEAE